MPVDVEPELRRREEPATPVMYAPPACTSYTFVSFVRELNSYGFRFAANRDDGDAFDAFAVDGFERGNREGLGGLRRKANYGRFRRDNNRVKTVSRLRGFEMFD